MQIWRVAQLRIKSTLRARIQKISTQNELNMILTVCEQMLFKVLLDFDLCIIIMYV